MPDKPSAYDTNVSIFLDTTVPNTTRIFDYLLGGSTNFEADRQAAEQMLKIMPSLQKWVRLRHAFVQEAAQVLREEGFTQFLDLGSGIPSGDQIHITVPDARVIYSDINPVAVSYGSSLYAELETVDFVFGDARDVKSLLKNEAIFRVFNPQEKVAIGLNALMLFLSAQDAKNLAMALYDWAPIGSKLFVVFQTRQAGPDPEGYGKFLSLSTSAGFPIHLYTLEQSLDILLPWHLCHIESVTDFLGLPAKFITDVDRTEIGMLLYAAFLSKEAA